MQKWEYLYAIANNAYIEYINHEEVANRVLLHEYLTDVGRDGWELISHQMRDGYKSSTNQYLIFKRPL